MPIPHFGSAPFQEPLTTKGDIFAYGASVTRLPVVYDGIPLQSASAQPIGLGYGTQAYNFNMQRATNAGQVLIGEASSSNTPLLEINDSATYTTGPTYYGLNINLNPTFATTNLGAGSSFLNVQGTWTLNKVASLSSFYGMQFAPTFAGSVTSLFLGGISAAPSFAMSHTQPLCYAIQCQPTNVSGTITKMIGVSIASAVGGTVSTMVGLDVGVVQSLAGSTVWAMQIGNYNSYFSGNTTFGGTAAPSFVVHVQGGNAATNAIGITPSTVAPSPAASVGAISLYQGTAGNKYFMVTYNDAGTTRYKYVILDTTGITWTEGTSLPT